MGLLEFGTLGFSIGALGIGAFTLMFLTGVRWWTDNLGRLLAGVFVVISAILVTSAYRALEPGDSHGFLVWRAILYGAFGLVTWMGLFTFIWTQFFAPRIRKGKKHEESVVADIRTRLDGGSDDHPASDR